MDNSPDWTLLRSFLTVAETGSLSAAATQLGLTQPTLGRQIKQLEAQLGLELFTRHARGLTLTAEGQSLLAPARRMQEAAQALSLAASGQDAALNGTVRLTASTFVAHHILPPVLASLREKHPNITLVLQPSDASENLLFREADIALRMYRSTQLDIITKELGTLPLGLFAARSYLAKRGTPQSAQDLQHHDLVGYDRNDLILRGMRAAGLPAKADWFSTRCDDQVTYWQLVRAGCGIGFSQTLAAREDDTVTQILPDLPIPALPLWLAAPEALRHTPRLRAVWDHLEEALKPLVS